MDFNEYFVERLIQERLREVERRALTPACSDLPRRPLRVTVGLAMIRAGRWLAGQGR